MNERRQAEIEIKRPSTSQFNVERTIATVLITEGSVRSFMLMQYDYIRLTFTLKNAVNFKIGDYIDDEIFGKFYITEQQMPTYNVTTGGYDYDLKFNAHYYRWANKVLMLTSVPTGGSRVRKETDWCLTDQLSVHLDEVIHNLNILGYTGISYTIEESAEKAAEVRFLQYSGIDIISALNRMAEEWECEWWVLDNVIHFGKCEDSGDPTDFELGVNVESMEIRENSRSYANKFFAYGSTRNLPYSYRKSLVFKVTDVDNGKYRDRNRDILLDMIAGLETQRSIEFNAPSQTLDTTSGKAYTVKWISNTFSLTSGGSLQGDIRAIVNTNMSSGVNSSFVVRLKYQANVIKTYVNESAALVTPNFDRAITINDEITGNVQEYYVEVIVTLSHTNTNFSILSKNLTSSLMLYRHNLTGRANLIFGGNTYPITFNPQARDNDSVEARYFSFNDSAPTGFGAGSDYTLEGLNIFNIPDSYYTSDYNDPSSLAKLGEVRLELPASTGGFIAKSGLTVDQTIESVIIFDDVYPHAIQKVTSVTTKNKQSEVVEQDGSKRLWAWVQYHLQAALADGTAFPFNTDYISDMEDLQVKFISREDLENAGYTHTSGAEYRLAGMTFNVGFDNSTQTYSIERNEDFGAKLPNETLRPMPGDPFVLLNWNVKAMESLNLITLAEQQLQSQTQAYLNAMEEDQFTFACNVMSDYLFELGQEIRQKYYNINIPFHVYDGSQLYVRMPEDYYILPVEGKRIRIIHGALVEAKVSRVIGYTFKLDKPYDTPQYEVGETERYSRLSMIEKQITKLS